jgi:hypothetical protein
MGNCTQRNKGPRSHSILQGLHCTNNTNMTLLTQSSILMSGSATTASPRQSHSQQTKTNNIMLTDCWTSCSQCWMRSQLIHKPWHTWGLRSRQGASCTADMGPPTLVQVPLAWWLQRSIWQMSLLSLKQQDRAPVPHQPGYQGRCSTLRAWRQQKKHLGSGSSPIPDPTACSSRSWSAGQPALLTAIGSRLTCIAQNTKVGARTARPEAGRQALEGPWCCRGSERSGIISQTMQVRSTVEVSNNHAQLKDGTSGMPVAASTSGGLHPTTRLILRHTPAYPLRHCIQLLTDLACLLLLFMAGVQPLSSHEHSPRTVVRASFTSLPYDQSSCSASTCSRSDAGSSLSLCSGLSSLNNLASEMAHRLSAKVDQPWQDASTHESRHSLGAGGADRQHGSASDSTPEQYTSLVPDARLTSLSLPSALQPVYAQAQASRSAAPRAGSVSSTCSSESVLSLAQAHAQRLSELMQLHSRQPHLPAGWQG